MNWKQRVREIAARNPKALHPIFQQSRPARTSGETVWDRAEWQTKGQGGIRPDEAARPILLVLHWLHRHQLLTERGIAMLSAPPECVSLTSSLVVPSAAQFLSSHYEKWMATEGLSLIMDASTSLSAERALEELWLPTSNDRNA